MLAARQTQVGEADGRKTEICGIADITILHDGHIVVGRQVQLVSELTFVGQVLCDAITCLGIVREGIFTFQNQFTVTS